MNTKRCPTCGLTKDTSAFSKHSGRKDGLQSVCKECMSVADRKRWAENGRSAEHQQRRVDRIHANKMAVLEYLSTHPCVDCGEADVVVLEFDHRDGVDKVGNVSDMLFRNGLSTIMAEIAKCDVRCANCHRRRTANNWVKGMWSPARLGVERL